MILARHPEMEVPFLYHVKRGVLSARQFLDFDGESCPEALDKLRYERKFVCFLIVSRIFKLCFHKL